MKKQQNHGLGGDGNVTGELLPWLPGGFTFNGLIVVTGAAGIGRTGGGSGSLQGNMVVAPYNAASMVSNWPIKFSV